MDIANLYKGMRVILGDNDPQGSTEFTDDMLADGIRTAYQLASFPCGYALDALIGGTAINPEPTVPAFATIMMESCLALMVGDQGSFSVKTRAISETDSGQKKRDILQYVRLKLRELRDGDAVFATRESFMAFLMTLDSFTDLAEVKHTGQIDVNVNVASDNVALFL